MSKVCTKCRTDKPLEDFHRNKRERLGRHVWCKLCVAAYHAAHAERKRFTSARWKQANKERRRLYARGADLRRKYGMTLEDYDTAVRSQRGVCAICLGSDGKTLVVDHDHKTGMVRGLLCSGCNALLGRAHDKPSILREAARYLESHGLRVVREAVNG